MKYGNIKYEAITKVDGEQKGPARYFCTERAYSNYANKQFLKYGNATKVTIYDYDTLHIITEYMA